MVGVESAKLLDGLFAVGSAIGDGVFAGGWKQTTRAARTSRSRSRERAGAGRVVVTGSRLSARRCPVGLLRDLDYGVKSPNGLQRGMQKFASSRAGAWLFSKTLYPLDKVLFRVTGGRLTLPSLTAGLPVIMLNTTGARSGKTRTMPLLGIPVSEDLAVIGSNYGQKSTPGWVYNLEADPSATVGYRDRTVAVTARRADANETDRAFDLAASVYVGYAKYRTRADHRVIRVFVLESSA